MRIVGATTVKNQRANSKWGVEGTPTEAGGGGERAGLSSGTRA
jgi:hypothetical protein